MYQIKLTHSGLSIGEIETMNNLFSKYLIYENKIDHDYDYASILDIELIKDRKISFFEFISIEKWSFLIDIIKNIKKRRGKKGLKLTITITEIDRDNQSNEDEYDELIVLKKIVFLLDHKDDLDFTKGLERIEITIENTNEMYEFQKSLEEQAANYKPTNDKIQSKSGESGLELIFFKFDESKRKWIKSIDKYSTS
ncbi:MAG: hypothetical protein H0X03_04420 [Nitrosopumilus sp.]|nr:hypothetical protein [Nitrosopumilus sp.]